jgi:Rieske Fe-S protein
MTSSTDKQPNSSTTEACCSTDISQGDGVARRSVLAAAGVVGAAGILAACGSSTDSNSATPATSASGSGQPDTVTDVPEDQAAIAATKDVPVGGATFVESRGIVVSQPTNGEFKAFEARCPHQGCMVTDTEDKDLLCPCHGSLFSAETGDVVRGPARTGLPEVQIKVSGENIVTA